MSGPRATSVRFSDHGVGVSPSMTPTPRFWGVCNAANSRRGGAPDHHLAGCLQQREFDPRIRSAESVASNIGVFGRFNRQLGYLHQLKVGLQPEVSTRLVGLAELRRA